MSENEIGRIAREICALLDQQMNAISGRGLPGLNEEELQAYQHRRVQIANLRDELDRYREMN